MARKILLVDDSRLFLEIERVLFRRTGADIYMATCGAEGLRIAIAEKPDLVVLDFMMPDITGDRVCAQIKTNPETADIPVIMVTTKGTVEDIERCRQAGCDDFVTKPLHHQKLLACAAQLLRIPHRKSMRMMIRLEANISGGNGNIAFGNSMDISTTGIFIETARVFQLEELVSIRFQLPHYGEISAAGRIARVLKREFRSFGYGIEFHELAEESRDAIARFVQPRRN